MARDIQADHVISSVSAELQRTIMHLFPDMLGSGPDDPQIEQNSQAQGGSDPPEGIPIPAPRNGYIQMIDSDTLLQIAQEQQLCLHIVSTPGAFVLEATRLAVVRTAHVPEDVQAQLGDAFVIGEYRTTQQDVLFGIDQLVEIALRALSPGINDPFTARACMNYLAVALCELARRRMPSAYRYDAQGQLRVIAPPVTFPQLLERAYGQIRQYTDDRVLLSHLLERLVQIAECVRTQAQRDALIEQAEQIGQCGQYALREPNERARLLAHVQHTVAWLHTMPLPQ